MWQWLQSLTLGDVGSLASLAGLGISGWVLYTVRDIQAFYVSRARLPALLAELQDNAARLSSLLNDYTTNEPGIQDAVARLEVQVSSVCKKLSGNAAVRARDALKETKAFRSNRSEAMARVAYTSVVQLVEDLRLHLQDLEWQR